MLGRASEREDGPDDDESCAPPAAAALSGVGVPGSHHDHQPRWGSLDWALLLLLHLSRPASARPRRAPCRSTLRHHHRSAPPPRALDLPPAGPRSPSPSRHPTRTSRKTMSAVAQPRGRPAATSAPSRPTVAPGQSARSPTSTCPSAACTTTCASASPSTSATGQKASSPATSSASSAPPSRCTSSSASRSLSLSLEPRRSD